MSFLLTASDLLSISLSFFSAVILWMQIHVDLQIDTHLLLIPPMIIFSILTYKLLALYPGVGIGPVEELKRLTTGSSFVLVAMITLSFFLHNSATYSRATFLMSWALTLASVPISRKVFRRVAVKLGFWGIPVAIAGKGEGVTRIQERLRLRPLSGLWPVICYDGLPEENKSISAPGIKTLILAISEINFEYIRHLTTSQTNQFKRIILILDETKSGPIWFTSINVVEHLSLEVANNLTNPSQQRFKRILELAIITILMPMIAILFLFISLAISINSRGSIFYKHKRIGHNGKDLWIWKFRTMVYNADEILNEHLANDPDLHKEWKENFKLRKDPRITPVGKLLRVTSLDELPQLWNVLTGEMSLIGPRPIVREEIPLYGNAFEIYEQALPGITGLWQISGRNDLPYQERVALDVYYIQNWSIWLDVHILMHTALTILQARGAY